MNINSTEKSPLKLDELFPQVDQITDVNLRTRLSAVWQELWSMSSWTDMADVPTSLESDYPTLPHNRCVLTMALGVANAFETHHGVSVDRDTLIAAAVLQDASKIVEFEPNASGSIELTERGKHYPHAFWAAHVALQHGIPDKIIHIILTHSPQSPKFPDSLEGKILYYVDQIDMIGTHKDRWRKELFVTK
ncbi:HD domain-containing protein [Bradyrhizobium diazoefficiens]|nr:HD domain-containing protein [Bradyrhizobium diazoefficiens]QQN65442.1 HD domain-containing protein [Bradyrhizobium diazoefficiens]